MHFLKKLVQIVPFRIEKAGDIIQYEYAQELCIACSCVELDMSSVFIFFISKYCLLELFVQR